MLEDLTVDDSQVLAEHLVRHLIDEAETLDTGIIADSLSSVLVSNYAQDLLAALLGIDTDALPEWVESVLEEPDWDPEY